MDFFAWLQVSLVCMMGAISPGPSLAVVLRNTLAGGKRQGVMTGLGHGLGIFFYAGLVVSGLAVVLTAFPGIEQAIGFAGIALLVWLGVTFLGLGLGAGNGGEAQGDDAPVPPKTSGRRGFAAGFLIAFLNPKIAAFFLAIFAPFIRAEAGVLEKAILALTAGAIDTGWYVLVALVLSGSGLVGLLRRHAQTTDRAIGVLLLVLAVGLLLRSL